MGIDFYYLLLIIFLEFFLSHLLVFFSDNKDLSTVVRIFKGKFLEQLKILIEEKSYQDCLVMIAHHLVQLTH